MTSDLGRHGTKARPSGQEVGRGIVNYSSVDAAKLVGKHSDEIVRVASSKNYDAFITRDNIAFLE